MLGTASPVLALAYLLCIAASVLGVAYGLIKWNDSGPLREELREWDQGASPESEK